VLAKKKDKAYRLCRDYRILNTKVLKNRFPVPLIDEVLDKMQNAKYFSVFDLKNWFFHVEIKEASRKYTAFVTKEGLFKFIRAPFGYCNSPTVFVRYVTYISTAHKCRYYENVHRWHCCFWTNSRRMSKQNGTRLEAGPAVRFWHKVI